MPFSLAKGVTKCLGRFFAVYEIKQFLFLEQNKVAWAKVNQMYNLARTIPTSGIVWTGGVFLLVTPGGFLSPTEMSSCQTCYITA